MLWTMLDHGLHQVFFVFWSKLALTILRSIQESDFEDWPRLLFIDKVGNSTSICQKRVSIKNILKPEKCVVWVFGMIRCLTNLIHKYETRKLNSKYIIKKMSRFKFYFVYKRTRNNSLQIGMFAGPRSHECDEKTGPWLVKSVWYYWFDKTWFL